MTNKRVMMKVGVFSTRSVELLLNKIEAIAVDQSFMGRVLGYGDIVVTGSGGTREAFSHIQGPLEFRRAVQSVTDTQSSPPPTAPSSAGKTRHPDSNDDRAHRRRTKSKARVQRHALVRHPAAVMHKQASL